MMEILDLVAYFQRQGYVHRNIAPSNFAVSFTVNGILDKVKVLDMGWPKRSPRRLQ